MDFQELEHFIEKKMRMTHIYQPLMIKTLLESNNIASVEQIARGFLVNDQPQLDYYKKIVKKWPHKTLKSHKVVDYEKGKYTLLLDDCTNEDRTKLITLCDKRLKEFIDKDPWIRTFRALDKKSISGNIRYDTLAKSKGVCVACGKNSMQALLHVDHIIPYSLGGETEPHNLQTLCSACNLEKNNLDDTDFIKSHLRMKYRRKDCIFCDPRDMITENRLACAIHGMESDVVVIPKRHVHRYSDLLPAEKSLCRRLVDDIQIHAKKTNTSIRGFSTNYELAYDAPETDHCCISITPKM